MNNIELKVQGIKDAIANHERYIRDHTGAVEELKKELEEAQKPYFEPQTFVICCTTREQLMALGAVANRPYQVAAVAMDTDGRIASSTTFEAVKDAVNVMLAPLFNAAFKEAYGE